MQVMQVHSLVAEQDTSELACLVNVEGIGWKTIRQILLTRKQLGFTWSEFWLNSRGIWDDCQLSLDKQTNLQHHAPVKMRTQFLVTLQKKGITLLGIGDEQYPTLLRQIFDPPWVLFLRGNNSILDQLKGRLVIAMVGTREPTSYGQYVVDKLLTELEGSSICVVSGGMYGIDLIAHQQAIKHGFSTIVVLGYGHDQVWPGFLKPQYEQLRQQGAVFVSEFPPSTRGNKGTFPMRNRVVAGLSHVTVVVEAAAESGSLITAGCAAEYGRLITAVPGPITNHYSEGTKALLNTGATLISSGQDILTELQGVHATQQEGLQQHTKKRLQQNMVLPQVEMSPAQRLVIEYLYTRAVGDEELCVGCGLHPDELSKVLLELELAGLVYKDSVVWKLAHA